MLTLKQVRFDDIKQWWDKVENYIASALKYSDDYTVEQIKEYVIGGALELIIITDNDEIKGAIIVSFINYPNHRIAFIIAIGGKLISNPDTFKQLCEIAKAHGATKIQGAVRDSVARLWKRFGFFEKYSIVETNV